MAASSVCASSGGWRLLLRRAPARVWAARRGHIELTTLDARCARRPGAPRPGRHCSDEQLVELFRHVDFEVAHGETRQRQLRACTSSSSISIASWNSRAASAVWPASRNIRPQRTRGSTARGCRGHRLRGTARWHCAGHPARRPPRHASGHRRCAAAADSSCARRPSVRGAANRRSGAAPRCAGRRSRYRRQRLHRPARPTTARAVPHRTASTIPCHSARCIGDSSRVPRRARRAAHRCARRAAPGQPAPARCD